MTGLPGCAFHGDTKSGVYTFETRQFDSISALHENAAVLPIAVIVVPSKEANDELNRAQRRGSTEFSRDLQRHLHKELSKGIRQGRITIAVQDVDTTNKKLDQEHVLQFHPPSERRLNRARLCELLGVDVLVYVELVVAESQESAKSGSIESCQATAMYYDGKNGRRIWKYKEILKRDELIELPGSVEERLLKYVSYFFPYEVILGDS